MSPLFRHLFIGGVSCRIGQTHSPRRYGKREKEPLKRHPSNPAILALLEGAVQAATAALGERIEGVGKEVARQAAEAAAALGVVKHESEVER